MALTPTEEAQTRALLAQQAELLTLAGSKPAIMSSLGATDVNLSQLPAASSVSDADLLLIRQGSTDKSVAGSVVKSYATTTVNDASETVKGIVELATAAEVQAGTDTTRAVHPAGLASLTATETRSGLIELATVAEAQAMSDAVRALSPARLASAFGGANQSLAASGYQKLPGGLILQWGNTAVATMDSYTITFPIAFPTACQLAIGGWVGVDSIAGVLGNATRTTTGLTGNMSGLGAATVNWVALGY